MAAMTRQKTMEYIPLKRDFMPFFPTEIIGHDGPIFTLSDIHGDIHSFIVSLRDCAKVIRKKPDATPLNPEIVDPDIERNLIIDISGGAADGGAADGGDYDVSLGYEWCGENAHVVICGDFIDPNRQQTAAPTCSKHPCVDGIPCNCTYYPQQEIKLLLLINELNRQAMINMGRIIKLLGNHEVANILSTDPRNGFSYHKTYTFSRDRELGTAYYLGNSRVETFNIGNHGYNLLFQDGCGLVIKINNTIFVHGKIIKEQNLQEINFKNQQINNAGLPTTVKQKVFQDFNIDGGLLTDRSWGDDLAYSKALTDSNPKAIEAYNNDIMNTIKDFLQLSESADIRKYRVVIGHCTQFDSTIFKTTNTTFIHKSNEDSISKTYNALKPSTHIADLNNQDTIFGITMAASKEPVNGLTDHYLYRVDVGGSREFDKGDGYLIYSSNDMPEDPIQSENKLLFSKTPQILAIHNVDDNDIITIIKSKMWNTRKHLPRLLYERMITLSTNQRPYKPNLASLNDETKYDPIIVDPMQPLIRDEPDDVGTGAAAEKKYLKYKKKYLDLKREMALK
jgi:hypothetical protein